MALHGVTYDDALLQRIVDKAFVGKNVVSSERYANGFMNVVLRVTLDSGECVIKLSDQRDSWSVEKELFCFEMAKAHGIPVPNVYWADCTKNEFPYEVVVMERLHGESVEDRWESLSPIERIAVTKRCGELLAKVHSITFSRPGSIKGTQIQEYEDLYAYYAHGAEEDFGIADEMAWIPADIRARVRANLSKNEAFLRSQKQFCLTHLDFSFWHVFIDADLNITGLIDWGFCDISMPPRDFVKPHRWIFNRGAAIEQAFMDGYSAIHSLPSDFEEQLLYYRCNMDVKFIERLVKLGNEELAQEYVAGLRVFIPRVEAWLARQVQKP